MQGWQVFFEIPGKPPVELRDGESIIGRSRTSAVHIPETTVSRQHAKVAVVGGGDVRVSDLGSSNGTFVNGEKVEGERRLADGDRVLIGDAELIIRILAPEPPADATVRVSIPPMGAPAPAAAGTVRMDLPPPAAGPGAATIAAPLPPPAPAPPPAPRALDLPLEPPRRAEPPPPPTPATPPPAPRPSLAPPPPPISAPVALPPSPAPSGGGDVLSSIDFDKLGGAPAAAAPAAAARRAPPGAPPARRRRGCRNRPRR
jgi:predicted component of type VI protein secretion system